ncbi:hypothetical protein HER39_09130, partial [Arthrobacter deserti]|nr:hypothetical protein [Arthrobacter deserti]
APASGPADTPLVAAGARADGTGSQAAEEEPIDGWTLSAADTAATDPPVEEQYIEDIAVAPHAAPIDPGSEPDPWRIRRTASPAGRAAAPSRAGIPRTEGTQPAGKSPGTADRAPVPPEDVLFGAPEWAGDDGERLADPGSPEGGPGEADRPRQ